MNIQREAMQKAVTEYDKKELQRHIRNSRVYYNLNAFGLYMDAVDRACEAIQQGTETRTAILDCFCGRLLNAVLKSVGEAKATDQEQRIDGKFGF